MLSSPPLRPSLSTASQVQSIILSTSAPAPTPSPPPPPHPPSPQVVLCAHRTRKETLIMGIKSFRLASCFHVMSSVDAGDNRGPTAPSAAARVKASALFIRLIRADGSVEVYHRNVSAAELMREHPMHLVCRSDAFVIGQPIPALAESDQLQLGQAYFLLPLHFFQSVLSFVTLASSFARAAATSSSSASPLMQRSFEIYKAPSGKLQLRVRDDFMRRILEAKEVGQGGGQRGGEGKRVCTTAALEDDYRRLVVGCRERQWKPKLETITELERKRGKSTAKGRGGAGAFDGIGRRQKKKSHEGNESPEKRQPQKQGGKTSKFTKRKKKSCPPSQDDESKVGVTGSGSSRSGFRKKERSKSN